MRHAEHVPQPGRSGSALVRTGAAARPWAMSRQIMQVTTMPANPPNAPAAPNGQVSHKVA